VPAFDLVLRPNQERVHPLRARGQPGRRGGARGASRGLASVIAACVLFAVAAIALYVTDVAAERDARRLDRLEGPPARPAAVGRRPRCRPGARSTAKRAPTPGRLLHAARRVGSAPAGRSPGDTRSTDRSRAEVALRYERVRSILQDESSREVSQHRPWVAELFAHPNVQAKITDEEHGTCYAEVRDAVRLRQLDSYDWQWDEVRGPRARVKVTAESGRLLIVIMAEAMIGEDVWILRSAWRK